jgi:hypothetical protein
VTQDVEYRPDVVNVLAELRPASESDREPVAYEIALEGASQVIGFYAELIAREEAAGEPDTDAIARWRAEQQAWAARRRELTPQDTQEIAAIRSEGEDLLAEPSDDDEEEQEGG